MVRVSRGTESQYSIRILLSPLSLSAGFYVLIRTGRFFRDGELFFILTPAV